MKIIIEENEIVLKTIELSALQEKSLKILAKDSVDFLVRKIERILEFILEQAKQKFVVYEIEKKTDQELETIADKIEAAEDKTMERPK